MYELRQFRTTYPGTLLSAPRIPVIGKHHKGCTCPKCKPKHQKVRGCMCPKCRQKPSPRAKTYPMRLT